MSLTPEEITALQAKAARADELERRLNAVDGKKGEILDEKRRLQARIDELQQKEKERERKEMEEQGRLQELLDEAREQIAGLQKQLQDKDTEIEEIATKSQRDKARADFLAAVSADAQAPKQLWALLKDSAELQDGAVVVAFKGAKVPASELMAKVRQDPEWAHHAKPAGGHGGMGARAATTSTTAGSGSTENPWLTGNITQRIALQVDNPDLAARLKAEAEQILSAGKG